MEGIGKDCLKPQDGNKTETISIATERFNGAVLGDTNQYSYTFQVACGRGSMVDAGDTHVMQKCI